MSRNELPEWLSLAHHARRVEQHSIRQLLESDESRPERWQRTAPGVRLDFSRQVADESTLDLLFRLARACQVEVARDEMFNGKPVNTTEQRAAWHTALRSEPEDGDVARTVASQRTRMFAVADQLRSRHSRGELRDVIVIGIGGSDLGPRLVTEALGRVTGPVVHFVSNLDPHELDCAMAVCRPDETHVVAVSKSFGTLETLENLKAVRQWLGQRSEDRTHAVTAVPARAEGLGIKRANVLALPEWVGGRFSVWSACGLPIAIAHGTAQFEALLHGAHAMDLHFRGTPLEQNVPVLLALLDVWNSNFLGFRSRGVFPYSQRLCQLPAYLQQLEMESGGKRVDREGRTLSYGTSQVVWGGAGTTAQHSVFQFLHQGTEIVPAELVVIDAHRRSKDHRERLLTEFAVAQADALALGDFALPEKSRPADSYAQCLGSRPTVLMWLDDPSPSSIGALLALNEHRTVTRAALWNINAFDQWGVEIGKRLLATRSVA